MLLSIGAGRLPDFRRRDSLHDCGVSLIWLGFGWIWLVFGFIWLGFGLIWLGFDLIAALTLCVGFAGRGFRAAGQIFAREIVFVPGTVRGFRTACQISPES